MNKTIRIGSRGSDLALWQANFIQSQLRSLGYDSEIIVIKTKGDQIQHLSFDKIEGKGFFTKEIEDALLNNEIDLAVHSFKDLPTENPEGLTIAAFSYRENPADRLLIRLESHDPAMPLGLKKGAIVGTSSARRKAQIAMLADSIELRDLRGNVPTRLQKLKDGHFDAILLAAAGLERLNLNLEGLMWEDLAPEVFVPAPAQGVLGLQIREQDTFMHEVAAKLHHPDVAETVQIERNILKRFGGGCHMPVGVYTQKKDDQYVVWASSAKADVAQPIKTLLKGPSADELINQTLSIHQQAKKPSVFITRAPATFPQLKRWMKDAEIPFEGMSFLEFEALNFLMPTTHPDWIFFSSKRGVEFFFRHPEAKTMNCKFACVGEGTAQSLQRMGITPSFTGNSSDTENVVEDFNNFFGPCTIWMPIAEESIGKVGNALRKQHQVIELAVYHTTPVPITTDWKKHDILVFTSPSNTKAFFAGNPDCKDRKFIAIGPSTAEAIRNTGRTVTAISDRATEEGLFETICSNF